MGGYPDLYNHLVGGFTCMEQKVKWPRGLRLILWCSGCAVVVAICQIVFYAAEGVLNSRDAIGSGVGLCLACVCVITGIAGRRRAFSIVAFVTALSDFVTTCYVQIKFIPIAVQDIVAGHWPFDSSMINEWYFTWNAICLFVDAAIIYYLLRYERHANAIEPGGAMNAAWPHR